MTHLRIRDTRYYEKKMNQSCSNMLEFGSCGSFAKSWHPKSLEVERYIYISISRNVDTRKTIHLPVFFSAVAYLLAFSLSKLRNSIKISKVF